MRVANITEPAAAVVTELGLAENPTAYRAVAAEPTAKAQIAKAREIAGKKAKRGATTVIKAHGAQLDALVAAWKDARSAARREFLTWIGHAECHATVGPGAAGTQRQSPKSDNSTKVTARTRKAPQRETRRLEMGLWVEEDHHDDQA